MKLSLHGRIGAIALTGAVALSLTACGSDDPTGSGDVAAAPDRPAHARAVT